MRPAHRLRGPNAPRLCSIRHPGRRAQARRAGIWPHAPVPAARSRLAQRAELATRIVWPTLLFFVLTLIVAREAHRRAGPVGAAFAVMLIATSTLALAQFRPGRIDHHNAQILCAVAGLIFLVRSLDDRR